MRVIVPVLVATGLSFGCVSEPVDEPEPEIVALERAAPAHSVSGGGRIDYPEEVGGPGYSEYYGFSARQRADGSTEGQIDLSWDPPYDFRVHGDVTCLSVAGNSAMIGFVVTRSESGIFPAGSELTFEVRDNGSGANDPADTISFFTGGSDCTALAPGTLGAFDWTHGNVTVR